MAIPGATQTYATELAGLWTGLARALSDLEALAARPDLRLSDRDAPATLARLRYVLHSAGELTLGIEPPEGAEQAHTDLAHALAHARDVTAVVAELIDDGGIDAIQPVLHEWRGALFAVRLARTRAAAPTAESAPREVSSTLPPPATALRAITLILSGAATFAGGTLIHSWQIWTVGLLLLTVGCALSAQRR